GQDVTNLFDATSHMSQIQQQIDEKDLNKSYENVLPNTTNISQTNQLRKDNNEEESVPIFQNIQARKNSYLKFQQNVDNCNENFTREQFFFAQGIQIDSQYALLPKYTDEHVERKSTRVETIQPNTKSLAISQNVNNFHEPKLSFQNLQNKEENFSSDTLMYDFSYKEVEDSTKDIPHKCHENVSITQHNPTKDFFNSSLENSNRTKVPQPSVNVSSSTDILQPNVFTKLIYKSQDINEKYVYEDHLKTPQSKEELHSIRSISHDYPSLGMSSFSDIGSKYDECSEYKETLNVSFSENNKDSNIISPKNYGVSKSDNYLQDSQNINIESQSNTVSTYSNIGQKSIDIILPECLKNCHGTLNPEFEISNNSKVAYLILTTNVLEKVIKIDVTNKMVYVENGVVKKCKNLKQELQVQFDGNILNGVYYINVIWIGDKPLFVAKDSKTVEYYDIPAKYYGNIENNHLKYNISGCVHETTCNKTRMYVNNGVVQKCEVIKSNLMIKFDAHLNADCTRYLIDLIWVGSKPSIIENGDCTRYFDIPAKCYGLNDNHQILVVAMVEDTFVPITVNCKRACVCFYSSVDKRTVSSVNPKSLLTMHLEKNVKKSGIKWKVLITIVHAIGEKCAAKSINWPQSY
ncbi:unnamed protein product, partial [Meganyctiphanes norvegica]